MAIEIIEHRPGEGLDDFIRVGREVYRGDPAWIAPLGMMLRDQLSPRKNPFFDHAEGAIFIAKKDGRLAGRCTAQIDRLHLERYHDATGFFGFFDTIEDQEVARRLLESAEAWLRARGIKRVLGPFSLNINEETGCLIEGFEHPPVVMMPHARPYQAGLIEGAGYLKAKDFFAWRYDVGDLPPRAQRAWEAIAAMPEVKLRSMDKKHLERDIRVMMEIHADAWSENWGYIPATEKEVAKLVQDLRLILDEDLAYLAEIDGRPVGFCACVPNLNEAIRDLDGKLFPFGFAKLLWRLKVKNPKSARLMLLGIRKELRGVKRYGGLSLAMYVEVAKRGVAKGYEWGELSWTLEDNHPVNLGIKAMGAKVYKKYRVFEKALATEASS